jgi:hypothetical protein
MAGWKSRGRVWPWVLNYIVLNRWHHPSSSSSSSSSSSPWPTLPGHHLCSALSPQGWLAIAVPGLECSARASTTHLPPPFSVLLVLRWGQFRKVDLMSVGACALGRRGKVIYHTYVCSSPKSCRRRGVNRPQLLLGIYASGSLAHHGRYVDSKD